MSEYLYKAVDTSGVTVKGRIHAENINDLELKLDYLGYSLISAREPKHSFFSRRIASRSDLINFTFHLEQMTRAGVPIIDALSDLRDSLPAGHFKDAIASMVESITTGKSLSDALKEFPYVFDKIYIIMIEVGEESGQLPRVLKDLGETLRWIDEIHAHTKKVTMYPTVVAVVVLAVVCFLMVYLVPQLIPFIKEMGGVIPLQTRLLISVSDYISEYWYTLILGPLAVFTFIKGLARTNDRVALWIDGAKLKIPIIGSIMLKLKLARFCNYFSLLYSSGISVMEALGIAQRLFGNRVLEAAVQTALARIQEGQSISQSFQATDLFPALIVRMLHIGESTGQLDHALDNITYFYNREVEEAIDKLGPAIEPLLTVIMGLMMAWIMISVLGPVYDTMTTI
jgi:type IV pilus assembly protein PilC